MTARKQSGLSILSGITGAVAISGLTLSIAALTTSSALDSLPDARSRVLILAISAIVVSTIAAMALIMSVSGTWFRNSMELSLAIIPTIWMTAITAVIGLPILANQLGRDRDVLRVLDTGSSALLAIIGGTCAAVAIVCAGIVAFVVRRKLPDEQPPLSVTRRGLVSSTIATLSVCAAATVAIVLTAQPALDLSTPNAPEVPIAGIPTSVTETAYRLRLQNGNGNWHDIIPAGAGFVSERDDDLIAYDGATGAVRWPYDGSTIGGLANRPQVFGRGNDQVLVLVGRLISVGLNPMTGAVRWRSADPGAPTNDENWRVRLTATADTSVYSSNPDDSMNLVVMDPGTGTPALNVTVPCGSEIITSRHYLLRSSCNSREDFVLTNIATGKDQKIQIKPTTEWGNFNLRVVGPDVFAVTFRTSAMVAKPQFVAIVDGKSGMVVDEFTSPTSSLSPVHNNQVALVDTTGPFEQSRAVLIRDLSRHSWTEIPVAADVYLDHNSQNFDWAGNDLVITGRESSTPSTPLRIPSNTVLARVRRVDTPVTVVNLPARRPYPARSSQCARVPTIPPSTPK